MSGMEMLAMGLTGLGTVAGTAGALVQGQQQSAVYGYNADLARANADAALLAGSWQEQSLRTEAASERSATQAALGASGVALGTGSTLQVMVDDRAAAELDAQKIRWQAESEAAAYDNQANLFDAYGDAAVTTSFFNAGASLLTGGSKLASLYASSSASYGS